MFTNRSPFFTAGMVLISLFVLAAVLLALSAHPAALAVPLAFVALVPFGKRLTRRLVLGIAGVVYTEPTNISDVILSELGMDASREQVTVLSGQNLVLGTVIGKATLGALSETHAGNTGNGAMTIDAVTPALANCQVGVYTVKCIAAAANGGTFEVFDPKGNSLGIVVVAATFENQIKFVIADGGTDFIVGDTFLVTVAAGTGKVKILTPAALDGTQNAHGVTIGEYDATAADLQGVAIVREAVLKDASLTWPGGITQAQKDAAIAQLAAQHVTLRNTA